MKENQIMTEGQVGEASVTLLEQVSVLSVKDGEAYKRAGELWKAVRELRAKVSETFKPIIAAAFHSHKMAIAKKDELDKPLMKAELFLKSAMSDYDLKQERIKKEEEARLRAEALRQEEDKRLEAALAAEKAGDLKGAEQIINAEVKIVDEPVVKKETPKIQGGPVFRTLWDFEIVDAKEVPREFCTPDLPKIREYARAYKEKADLAGVKFFSRRV